MQTKHEACNSLLGFQGTFRMRPVEAEPQEHLWNMDMVQPGQAQVLGGRNDLVVLALSFIVLGVMSGALPHSGLELGSPLKPLTSLAPSYKRFGISTQVILFPRSGWVGHGQNSDG